MRTDRLVLRPVTEADVDGLVGLDGEPEVMRFLTGGRATPREAMVAERLPVMVGEGFWAAEVGGEFVGWFELRPVGDGVAELGYRLRRAVWGSGLATEGAAALLALGFGEWGLERVVATTMTVNARSRRVLEKVGMSLVRTFFEEWPDYIDGAEHGDVEYELTRARWSVLVR